MSNSLAKQEVTDIVITPEQSIEMAGNNLAAIARLLSEALREATTPKEMALIHETAIKGTESFGSFKEAARARLLDILISQGTKVTDKGTLQVELGEGRVQRAIPTNTKPNEKLVEGLLRTKGVSLESWMDRTVIYKVNEHKLKELLETKQLTKEEYDSCFPKPSYRIGKTEILGGEENE